jgi:hypothetical protein
VSNNNMESVMYAINELIEAYTLRMLGTLDRVNARHYIKKDLQPFLPPGYPNPVRVPQHHGPRNCGNRDAA